MDWNGAQSRFSMVVIMIRALCVWLVAGSSLLGAVRYEPYHGWEAAILSNGQVEAVIVPWIGRVMQFRFVKEEDGPFWENRKLDGKSPDPDSKEWGNFGGDKSWPSPQAAWGEVTGRGWPPPRAFDSMPVTATFRANKIILSSATDPHYGIKTERVISLVEGKPVMEIVTSYEKVSGRPVQAGVWIITQLKDPKVVTMPLPEKSIFPAGYNKQSQELPQDLKREGNAITCARSKTVSTKIGSDASRLIWEDSRWRVTIDSPRVPGGPYPDENSSAEIYTNPDPLEYVELEMLGPVTLLKPGDRISQTNTYRLERLPGK